MPTRLSDLPPALKNLAVYTIGRDETSPAVIDGKQNSTGHDIALVFSSEAKATAYRDRFPSLRLLNVYQTTCLELNSIFNGQVEYYMVDRE